MDSVANFLVPSGWGHVLFVLGLLAWAAKKTRISWCLLVASCGVALAFSSGMVAAALMSPLEYAHRGLAEPSDRSDVSDIVVLTGWASDDPNMPLSARLNASSLYRIMYALELHQARPDGNVIVSGGEVAARNIADLLGELGVPRTQMQIEGASGSTAASAIALREMIGENPFLLVTSAGHMPRALGALRAQGLNPVPAPTDYQLPKDWRYAEAKPTSLSLSISDLAVHEYSGLLWYRFRGWL